MPDLDEGETDCIRIATFAGINESLLLIDERAGRAVAQALGINIAGTAAIVGLAKRKGLIASVKAKFAILHASDFRISAAAMKTVLTSVGENR